MNGRKLLAGLVFTLPIMVVLFAVLMGAYALSVALRDHVGATVFLRLAMGAVVLLIADLLLLVTMLGLRAIEEDGGRNQVDPDLELSELATEGLEHEEVPTKASGR